MSAEDATATADSGGSALPGEAERDRRNRRTGLLLFLVYLLIYGGFMAWNVVDPASMARPVLLGMNLAIVYGFGLIAMALILAITYVLLCNRPMTASTATTPDGGSQS